MTAPLPLIPSTVCGSHGKAGWLYAAVKAFEHGDLGPGDMEEMFDDAADTAIRDMERAGLDIITDGEVRRLDGYVDSYYAIIKGIQPLPVRRKAGPWGYDQQTRYEAVGRIETPPGGLGIVKEFEYLKAHTTRRTKATCAGPLTFGSRIHPGKVYKGGVDVAERFAEVINAELKGLAGAGGGFIPADGPGALRARPLGPVRGRPGAGRRRHRREGVPSRDPRGRGRADPAGPEGLEAREALREPRLRLRLVAALHVQPEDPGAGRRRRPRQERAG